MLAQFLAIKEQNRNVGVISGLQWGFSINVYQCQGQGFYAI